MPQAGALRERRDRADAARRHAATDGRARSDRAGRRRRPATSAPRRARRATPATTRRSTRPSTAGRRTRARPRPRRDAKRATVRARRTPAIPRRSSRSSSTRFQPRKSPPPARPATTRACMPCGKAASTKRATSSCISCHSIHKPMSTTAQLKAVNQQAHVHHLPSRQGGETRQVGPHAGARRQDGVHVVPQPARHDQRAGC